MTPYTPQPIHATPQYNLNQQQPIPQHFQPIQRPMTLQDKQDMALLHGGIKNRIALALQSRLPNEMDWVELTLILGFFKIDSRFFYSNALFPNDSRTLGYPFGKKMFF